MNINGYHAAIWMLAITQAVASMGCSHGPPANQAKAIQTLEKSCAVKFELNDNGDVVSLQISSPALTDETALPIQELTQLERLSLKQTGISDATLQHIGKLGNLRTLYLDEVAISSEGLTHLAGCRHLEELTLAGCPIDDAAASRIASFSRLRLLDLSRTKFADPGMQDLGSVANLEVIYLTGTPITGKGIAQLKGSPKLQLVDLSGIPVDDQVIETVAQFSELERLYLGQSSLNDDLLPSLVKTLVTSNKKLRGLAIPDVPLTNDSIEPLKQLQELPELALVDMRNTKITKDAFRDLTKAVTQVNFTADYPIED